MTSFEQEIKNYFINNNIQFIDNSSEYKLLDFVILNFATDKLNGADINRKLFLEVKEKRQAYNISNWNMIDSQNEPFTFIVDELSCRKILAYAPFSGLLVRDNNTNLYYWFSVLDLFLMPKIRANREIQKNSNKQLKGKLFLDFRNAVKSSSLEDAFRVMHSSISNRVNNYIHLNECYGVYVGEKIPLQGIKRVSGHWDIDVSETR